MLVTDDKIFDPMLTPSKINLKITNIEGESWQMEVSGDLAISQLKVMSSIHFYNSSEDNKASMYKLIDVSRRTVLCDESTVHQQGLTHNDDVLLLRKRRQSAQSTSRSRRPIEDLQGGDSQVHVQAPTQADIDEATADVPQCNVARPLAEATDLHDFQTELRKILISLIDAAQKILCLSPRAAELVKEAGEMLQEKNCNVPDCDPEALSQLKEMGFTEARAKKALILNKMSPMLAMDWLLQHEDDPDVDQPLPDSETTDPSQPMIDHTLTNKSRDNASVSVSASPPSNAKQVKEILENFKSYKSLSFNPNPVALHKLIEMGFEEKDVCHALRVNGNNQDLACEWLLDPNRKSVSVDCVDQGMDTDGAIYIAIMESPVVQLGLNNPRSLLAFLEMIENPVTTNRWLNDPDTGPMLIQISRIYHAEKHAAASASASTGAAVSSST